MKTIFTTVIQSCKLSQIPLHTEIYNVKDFSEIVCVKLPPELPRDMDLTGLYNLDTDKDLDFKDYTMRDEHKPWIDFSSSLLLTGIGQHTYRMTFEKEDCRLKAICWFSYIIQDNNPEKSYIYMNRESGGDDPSGSEG